MIEKRNSNHNQFWLPGGKPAWVYQQTQRLTIQGGDSQHGLRDRRLTQTTKSPSALVALLELFVYEGCQYPTRWVTLAMPPPYGRELCIANSPLAAVCGEQVQDQRSH